MDLGLKGKYAFVTGGSKGIGKAIAVALSKEGCNVAICARNKQDLEITYKEIKNNNVDSFYVECDVLKEEDIKKAIYSITTKWHSPDILINNVGGGGRWGKLNVLETGYDVWQDVYNKNVRSTVLFSTAFLSSMINKKWGRIVTISSIFGIESSERPWFGSSKSSEIYIMKSFSRSREFSRSNVTFNTVCPGGILTDGWKKDIEKNKDNFAKKLDEEFTLGRLGTPEEVANVVSFICSTQSSLLNGSCIVVDGGESKIVF